MYWVINIFIFINIFIQAYFFHFVFIVDQNTLLTEIIMQNLVPKL